MALSTTFTQCASETTKVGKITLNKGHFAVQGHSRSFKITDFGTNGKLIYDFLLVINTNLPPILHCSYDMAAENFKIACIVVAHPPAFRRPEEWFNWDDLRKIFRGCQWMAKVPNGVEKLPKISTG